MGEVACQLEDRASNHHSQGTNPGGLAECRNISCTSAFSKILEGVVMLRLRDEEDRSQYGGKPKCGAEHMLIDIWEKVTGAMDGGQNAAVLLGVDSRKSLQPNGTCRLP